MNKPFPAIARAAPCLVLGVFFAFGLRPAFGGTNESCEQIAFREYNMAKANASEAINAAGPYASMTVEYVILKRRMLEGYCLKVAGCTERARAGAGTANIEANFAFAQCIEDEEKENVLSRLANGDRQERDEAIAHLKGN